MAVQPTNKSLPLTADIVNATALTQSINTAAREQLSVILAALDQQIATNAASANTAISNEATARMNADTTLQNNINSEAATRAANDTTETNARIAADTAEATARSSADTILQNEVDGERGLLRLTATGTNTQVSISSSVGTRITSAGASGSQLGVPSGSYQSTFAGATIDFAAGTITYTGGTPTASTFTLATYTGQANQYTKYSIVLLPTAPDTLQVTAVGSFASTAAAVPSPTISGGVPVGLVTVQVNSAATGIGNITQTLLTEFPSKGSGSGSGTGSSPLDPRADETFTYYTRSDFSVDGSTFFGSTTGTNSITGQKKVVLNVGQQFVSSDLTGPQVRADGALIQTVQARLLYNQGKLDTSPLIEFSRDGGNSYQTATNVFPGSASSTTYFGNIVEGDLTFVTSSTANFDGGTANSTISSGQKVAAIFTPTYRIMLTSFQLNMNTTATTGTVAGQLYSVSSGSPNVLLATSSETFVAGQDITSTTSYKQFDFGPIALSAGTQYALVVSGTGLNANLNVTQVTTPAAFNNSSATNNGASWTPASAALAFRLFGIGADLRLRITSNTAASELAGFGVEYVNNTPAGIQGIASYEERTITSTEASTGLITFAVIKYTPGARQLKMQQSGHIFMAGDFVELSPSQVQFPANFFRTGDFVRFYNDYGLVDGSSVSLGKINSIYDAIVGSSAQAAAGVASTSSLANALTAFPNGNILVLKGYSTSETITISGNPMIQGQGSTSAILGNVSITGSYATLVNLRFSGNLTLSGSGNYVQECFAAPTSVITDTGSNNKQIIVGS